MCVSFNTLGCDHRSHKLWPRYLRPRNIRSAKAERPERCPGGMEQLGPTGHRSLRARSTQAGADCPSACARRATWLPSSRPSMMGCTSGAHHRCLSKVSRTQRRWALEDSHSASMPFSFAVGPIEPLLERWPRTPGIGTARLCRCAAAFSENACSTSVKVGCAPTVAREALTTRTSRPAAAAGWVRPGRRGEVIGDRLLLAEERSARPPAHQLSELAQQWPVDDGEQPLPDRVEPLSHYRARRQLHAPVAAFLGRVAHSIACCCPRR